MCIHIQIQKDRHFTETIDERFRTRNKKRFQLPKQSPSGTRLLVDSNIVSDPAEVSTQWATHFEQILENQVLQELQSNVTSYQSGSLLNEDYVFDFDIEITEIEAAIAKLRHGKSAGPDGILPEHLIYMQWPYFQAMA